MIIIVQGLQHSMVLTILKLIRMAYGSRQLQRDDSSAYFGRQETSLSHVPEEFRKDLHRFRPHYLQAFRLQPHSIAQGVFCRLQLLIPGSH